MTVIISEHGALPIKAQRIAEIIQDFDPTLELRWIPPENRTAFDNKPFAIWQVAPGFPPYIVMSLSEDELDHRVLASLFNASNKNGNILDKIEAEEAAKQVLRMKERMEIEEELRQFSVWALRQDKTVKHNGVEYR